MPDHHNAQGILGTLTVLTGPDIDESKTILQTQNVDFVVLYVNSVKKSCNSPPRRHLDSTFNPIRPLL